MTSRNTVCAAESYRDYRVGGVCQCNILWVNTIWLNWCREFASFFREKSAVMYFTFWQRFSSVSSCSRWIVHCWAYHSRKMLLICHLKCVFHSVFWHLFAWQERHPAVLKQLAAITQKGTLFGGPIPIWRSNSVKEGWLNKYVYDY